MNKDKLESVQEKDAVKSEKKPNDSSGVYISTHFKIFDPNTKEVLVQQRGD